jgi:hypothetical protein
VLRETDQRSAKVACSVVARERERREARPSEHKEQNCESPHTSWTAYTSRKFPPITIELNTRASRIGSARESAALR